MTDQGILAEKIADAGPAARELRELVPEHLAAAISLSVSPIVFLSLTDLRFIAANAAALDFFGTTSDTLPTLDIHDFVIERDAADFEDLIASLKSSRCQRRSCFLSAGDGVGLARVAIQRVGDILVLVDQTKPGSLAKSGLSAVDTDPLTGLMNRRLMKHKLQLAMDRADTGWGILFIDLNNYKLVNDLHGHVAGDKVLTEFSRKLEVSIRPGDSVARYGGDEFIVLVDRVPSGVELRSIAARVASEVRVCLTADPPVTVTASVGCAMASEKFETIEQLVAAADRDMYRAKRAAPR